MISVLVGLSLSIATMNEMSSEPDFAWTKTFEQVDAGSFIRTKEFQCNKDIEVISMESTATKDQLQFEGIHEDTELNIELWYEDANEIGGFFFHTELTCDSEYGDCYHSNIMDYEPHMNLTLGCPK